MQREIGDAGTFHLRTILGALMHTRFIAKVRHTFVSHFGWYCLASGVGICRRCADPSLLKGVETRYNRAKTLQVLFHEAVYASGTAQADGKRYAAPAQARAHALGLYDQPKGKLFLSDGKNLYLYTPAENRVEKMKMKESDDMRAPLAFLLGKLNFEKEFRNFQSQAGGRRHADHRRTQDRQPALLRRSNSSSRPD